MKVNKPMFVIGIAIIVIAAILVTSNFMGVSASPAILGAILGILGILLLGASVYSPLRQIKVNKPMFAIGLIIVLVAASMEFCQERCFLGVDLEFWPMVLGIIGIGLIATSGYQTLRQKKK